MSIPFILDTDTAQDDCVAILVGLLDPVADIRAITMVAGNIGFDRQVQNACMSLSVAGLLGSVPIHLGCTQPIMRPWESAENVHGDGSGGLSMEMPENAVSAEHAVNAMLRITAEAPGEVSIVAIGPLTNVATAVVMDRTFASRVKSLYIMGGSNNGRGNVTPAAEFNFYVDPEAAQTVFEAGFADVRVIDWDPVTFKFATFTRAEYNLLTDIPTPLAAFYKAVCDTTLDFNESVDVDGSTHPDSMTLAALLHPELVHSWGNYRVDVDTTSTFTRGYSAMAWDKFDIVPNAKLVEDADRAGFYSYLEALLRLQTTPSVPIAGLRNV